ncbi:hypothetical protein [Mycolicibacterium conceptionense]|uniref:hypothetical protein n=1 Tax=Mycolicibacterium conceptionense TaxID=451644 RepID=UPI0007EC95FF|nr:hypothetical protein [Mycolicibacterium conceptionense]OBJ92674.1 hypothetical protein A5639_07700 [Mycolicibacterium conceptionense]
MLRSAISAIAAVCAIALVGSPTAAAEPTDKGSTTRSAHEEPKKITIAAPKPPNWKDPKLHKQRTSDLRAGSPVEDYRIARKRTMDRYFGDLWSGTHH